MKKFGLTTRIMIGLALGVVFGLILSPFSQNPFVKDVVIDSILAFFGGMFINLMKVMIVPLVSISLAMGAASIGDVKKLRRIGTKVLGFYFATTAIAVAIGLFVAKITNVGKGMIHGNLPKGEYEIAQQSKLIDVLLDMIPKNIVNAAEIMPYPINVLTNEAPFNLFMLLISSFIDLISGFILHIFLERLFRYSSLYKSYLNDSILLL